MGNVPIKIVLVGETEIQAAAEVHSAAWKESHRVFCSPAFVEQHTPERQRAYLQGKMEQGSRVYMLLAETPTGIVSVKDDLIEDLYVLPTAQNRGYGTCLLRYAIEQCAGTPTLWILENNRGAERLYRRCGFRETGKRIVHPGKIDEIEFSL